MAFKRYSYVVTVFFYFLLLFYFFAKVQFHHLFFLVFSFLLLSSLFCRKKERLLVLLPVYCISWFLWYLHSITFGRCQSNKFINYWMDRVNFVPYKSNKWKPNRFWPSWTAVSVPIEVNVEQAQSQLGRLFLFKHVKQTWNSSLPLRLDSKHNIIADLINSPA